MSIDRNGQYTGNLPGKDRQGHTTPDLEASHWEQPYLPVPYPAPYLPGLRQDQGHPILAQVVLSSQALVGLDKSGALVPAGMLCGNTGANAGHATGGGYYAIKYSVFDLQWGTLNPKTGVKVAAAGEVAVIAAPTGGVAGDVITFTDGSTYTVTTGDVTFAQACDLFAGGIVQPVGCTLRNVWQYLGGVTVISSTTGVLYTLNGLNPLGFSIHNYMNDMGTAIRTQYYIRVPWIGALPTTLKTLTSGDGVTGYISGPYGLTFTHYTGAPKNGANVVASRFLGDAGNYTDYNSAVHTPGEIVGNILGVVNMINKVGFANRVKTLWDPSRLQAGGTPDPNQASIMMGGSATAGLPFDINLTTGAAYALAKKQGKAVHAEYGTYVLIRVNL
jgi:hypothetical protein